ncbi:MAG: deoxyhypusine synthase [Planctomycetes bacterium]|nr:deoxyhypusine synthase [Planctomycetota bacterium]
MKQKQCPHKAKYLSGKPICPKGITGKETISEVMEETFMAYNAARLKEGCRLFTEKMLAPDVVVGMSLAGALTPAGLGSAAVIPLINAGFVDWIVSTGANMYHDLHFALGKMPHVGTHLADDADLRKNDIVRIYDIFLDYSDNLMYTDENLRQIFRRPEFQKEMGTAEFYHLLGRFVDVWEKENGLKNVSVLAAAYRAGVPVYTSSPGDSTIGMNIAGVELEGNKLRINPSVDVNETTAIVLQAKRSGGKSAVFLVGGGSPKNFMLQTEPQIQEVLRIKEMGHDYFVQITNARPDTGGLSVATPHEAVSWGKIDPDKLPDAIVCYLDVTVALPLVTHYAMANHKKRNLKRLYSRREEYLQNLVREYFTHNKHLTPPDAQSQTCEKRPSKNKVTAKL